MATTRYKKLRYVQEGKGKSCKWWLYDPNCDEYYGPYNTKDDAREDKEGIDDFYKYEVKK